MTYVYTVKHTQREIKTNFSNLDTRILWQIKCSFLRPFTTVAKQLFRSTASDEQQSPSAYMVEIDSKPSSVLRYEYLKYYIIVSCKRL